MKKSKYLLFLIIPLILIASFYLFRQKSGQAVPSPTPEINKAGKDVTINLEFSSDNKVKQTYSLSENESVLSLLEKITSEKSITLKTKKYDFGSLVEQIGEAKNSKEKAWIYFVNDQSATIGADKYMPKPGDRIDWKYIKPEF